uniref:Ig-like domain-containing protein n=1 Tax=Acanthochromis polyacanthus TaxID=80966 RepID=A0A3Q1GVC7_9TELE
MCLSFFVTVFSAEDFYQSRGCCTFRGPNFEDTEFIIKFYFNENLMMEYNSTRGNWTGSTNYSFEIVKTWNSDPYAALTRALEKKTLCEGNFTSAPTIKVKAVKQASMLVCSAYNFYPKQIMITWLRNGQEVTSGISSSLAMPDGEFYYQIHSYLEFTPTHGENITCMVEHYSLSEPALVVWGKFSFVMHNKHRMSKYKMVKGFNLLFQFSIYNRARFQAKRSGRPNDIFWATIIHQFRHF